MKITTKISLHCPKGHGQFFHITYSIKNSLIFFLPVYFFQILYEDQHNLWFRQENIFGLAGCKGLNIKSLFEGGHEKFINCCCSEKYAPTLETEWTWSVGMICFLSNMKCIIIKSSWKWLHLLIVLFTLTHGDFVLRTS